MGKVARNESSKTQWQDEENVQPESKINSVSIFKSRNRCIVSRELTHVMKLMETFPEYRICACDFISLVDKTSLINDEIALIRVIMMIIML